MAQDVPGRTVPGRRPASSFRLWSPAAESMNCRPEGRPFKYRRQQYRPLPPIVSSGLKSRGYPARRKTIKILAGRTDSSGRQRRMGRRRERGGLQDQQACRRVPIVELRFHSFLFLSLKADPETEQSAGRKYRFVIVAGPARDHDVVRPGLALAPNPGGPGPGSEGTDCPWRRMADFSTL